MKNLNRTLGVVGLLVTSLSVGVLAAEENTASSSTDLSLSDSKSEGALYKLKTGLLIDTYYAFDYGQPRLFNRSFTVQAVRHNEFNLNLLRASIGHEAQDFRAHLALQAGTSVQSAYLSEYKNGAVSGGDLARHIGQATIGVNSGQDSWFDIGIMPSIANLESFVTSDNWTYTRTIIGEQLPSYQAGAQFTSKLSDSWTVKFAIVNGWQIISESNTDKSLVLKLDYFASPDFRWEFASYNGKEAHSSLKAHTFRNFNELMLTIGVTEDIKIRPLFVGGLQQRTFVKGSDFMWGGGLLTQFKSTDFTKFNARIEFFSDRSQTLVKTTSANGYFAWAIGAGIDHDFTKEVLGRIEFRGYGSQDEIFPASAGMARLSSATIASLALKLN